MRSVSTPASISRAARRIVYGRVLENWNQPVSLATPRYSAVAMARSNSTPHASSSSAAISAAAAASVSTSFTSAQSSCVRWWSSTSLGFVPARDALLQARELRPRAGVGDEQRVERVERKPLGGPAVLDVVVRDVVVRGR